ncbi:uncharacterized protein EHS24_006983 [Apiotrichum porosum]|uniref:F-box domain-containing protein n=1 Tax=Apiotrichum porosum TaxID=105984 RepID=A0A427XWY3_9TREE|nr:uncharacterized protein EHS24_006983 [Apiotrichum porosum]RSH83307.1 hypothetical protein EHS24_006983 [Apiotrichum porosum]
MSVPPGSSDPLGDVLSPLPPEVLVTIIEQLHRTDLATCLRVNSVFCSIALPLVYRHLRLNEFGPWPSFDDHFDDHAVPGPLSTDRPKFLRRGALGEAVRRLDVLPHKTTVCRSSTFDQSGWWHALPPLPRLEVVRVFMMATWAGGRVFHTNVDPRDAERKPDMPCAALTHIRSPMLVIRGVTLAQSTVPRHEIPWQFSEGVRHLACVFQPDHPYFLPRDASEHAARRQAMHFRSRIPNMASRLTVVFWPPGPTIAWRSSAQTLSWELIWAYASALFSSLAAWVALRQPQALTLVNVRALRRVDGSSTTDEALREVDAEVESFFRSAVEERFPDEGFREKVLSAVRIIDMDEYLETDDWRTVFEPGEVAPWMGGGATVVYPPSRSSSGVDTPLTSTPGTPSTTDGSVRALPMFQLTVSG